MRYLAIRLAESLVTLAGVTVIAFLLVRMTGDPLDVLLPVHATAADRAALASQLGLDRPLTDQYVSYLGALAHGDLGTSIYQAGQPVGTLIAARFPATVRLAVAALLIALAISVPVAILGASRPGSVVDEVGKLVALAGQSLPVFWLGIVLVLLFAVDLRVFPVAGDRTPMAYVLPSLCLGAYVAAGITRILRSSLIETLAADHIRFLRAEGIAEASILLRHALRNAAVPALTFTGTIFAGLLTGSVVTEAVFAWPGVGQLALQSFLSRDYPVVQGVLLLFAFVTVAVNLAVDALYAVIDPRIRVS